MSAQDDTLKEALLRIEADLREIATSEHSVYDAGWRVYSEALGHADKSRDILWPLWLMWGALTDWLENRPHEANEAEAAMRRAAREWLSLANDQSARDAYFERWLYDELGYERARHVPESDGAG